jgi:mono/diheme cytochrome c family protein
MNRLVIESIEGRIIAGITMFVAIMVLIGWVAINEPARMASFERQSLGRSIERGGELYAANCATCHGANGYGQADLVPALNSPQFFGHDFLAEVNGPIGRLQRQQAELRAQASELLTERNNLLAESTSLAQPPAQATPGAEATAEPAPAVDPQQRQAEIIARINEIDAQLDPSVEGSIGAQIAAIDVELEPLLAQREDLLATLQPAIDRGYLAGIEQARANAELNGPLSFTEFLDRSADRLSQAGWGSDVASFVRTTLYHGRPGTTEMWQGRQMVAWAQLAGGPLRNDQIDDLTNFIVAWDKGDAWTLDDLFAVQQFMKLKADASLVSAGPAMPTIRQESGNDLDQATALVTALTGDPERGQGLYNGAVRSAGGPRLACSTCHAGGAQAPATEEKWDTVLNVRLALPEFSGWTVEKYLIDGIIYPNDYVVPGYASGVMPATYGDQLSAQDLADILAYLKTYSKSQ